MKITAASLLSKHPEAEKAEYAFLVPGSSRILLYNTLNSGLAMPDRLVILITVNSDFLIDPDEIRPMDRWVKVAGKFQARRDNPRL
jgi:hypothetical protein